MDRRPYGGTRKQERGYVYMYMYVALCPTLAMYPEDVCL